MRALSALTAFLVLCLCLAAAGCGGGGGGGYAGGGAATAGSLPGLTGDYSGSFKASNFSFNQLSGPITLSVSGNGTLTARTNTLQGVDYYISGTVASNGKFAGTMEDTSNKTYNVSGVLGSAKGGALSFTLSSTSGSIAISVTKQPAVFATSIAGSYSGSISVVGAGSASEGVVLLTVSTSGWISGTVAGLAGVSAINGSVLNDQSFTGAMTGSSGTQQLIGSLAKIANGALPISLQASGPGTGRINIQALQSSASYVASVAGIYTGTFSNGAGIGTATVAISPTGAVTVTQVGTPGHYESSTMTTMTGTLQADHFLALTTSGSPGWATSGFLGLPSSGSVSMDIVELSVGLTQFSLARASAWSPGTYSGAIDAPGSLSASGPCPMSFSIDSGGLISGKVTSYAFDSKQSQAGWVATSYPVSGSVTPSGALSLRFGTQFSTSAPTAIGTFHVNHSGQLVGDLSSGAVIAAVKTGQTTEFAGTYTGTSAQTIAVTDGASISLTVSSSGAVAGTARNNSGATTNITGAIDSTGSGTLTSYDNALAQTVTTQVYFAFDPNGRLVGFTADASGNTTGYTLTKPMAEPFESAPNPKRD